MLPETGLHKQLEFVAISTCPHLRGVYELETGTLRTPVSNYLVLISSPSSGATGDGPDQLYRLATEGPIDAIFADYLAEMNIVWRALEVSSLSRVKTVRFSQSGVGA